jgi:hypothetical protein
MKPGTVVFFDDYLPEMPFIGCKFILDEIDKTKYDVEVMPDIDDYPKPWGKLRSQLLAVQLKEVNVNRFSIVYTDKPALHVLGLAHTRTTKEFSACAYTQKVLKMCQMMKKLGYEIYHYGAEGSTPDCTEHIDVVSTAIQRQTYGDYDWKKEFFKHDPHDLAYTTFNENAIREINARKGPRDLLLISMGNYQKPISDAVGLMPVEMGIGYSGVFTNQEYSRVLNGCTPFTEHLATMPMRTEAITIVSFQIFGTRLILSSVIKKTTTIFTWADLLGVKELT